MKKTLSVIIIFLAVLGLNAQSVSLEMQVSPNPTGVGQPFKFTIILRGAPGSISPPDLSQFKVERNARERTGVDWNQRGMPVYFTREYYLSADKIGKFKIKGATAQTVYGSLKAEDIEIEIVKSKQSAQTQSPVPSSREGKCMITAYVNKKKVVIGEPVVVSYVLYNRHLNFSLLPETERARHPGFWQYDVELNTREWDNDRSTINGESYQKATIARQVIIPQRTGELELDPYVRDYEYKERRMFLRKAKMTSNTPVIEVMPHPAGAPNNFNGAVGSLDMSVELSSNEVKANEALDLKVRIEGKGNLELIDEPVLKLPSGFELYDPKVSDNIRVNSSGMSGSRTFEYLIIPRYDGEFELDPIEFHYYDPVQEQYKTRTSKTYTVRVLPGEGSSADISTPSRAKRSVEGLGSDIRHILTSPIALNSSSSFFARSFGHIALTALPFLLMGVFTVLQKRREEQDQDVIGTRRKSAGKVAQKLLKVAHSEMDEPETFYSTLYRTMNDYISRKMNLSTSEMSREEVQAQLETVDLTPDIRDRWMKALADCEMSVYAPGAVRSPRELYEEVSDLVGAIEGAT